MTKIAMSRIGRRSALKGGAAAAVMAATPLRLAGAAEVTLRVHHFLPALATTQAGFIEPWAKRVEEASEGRIRFEIYPSMQLGGSPPQLYDQVRDGVVDLIWTLPGYTAGRFPTVEVFELPFMAAASAEATSQALEAFAADHLQEEFADIKPLLLHVHAPGSLHMRDKPVERLEDLRGLKIRAPSRVAIGTLETLGATPVGMPVPAVPESLSRGVIDGTALPFEVTLPLRVHELVSSHTEIVGPRGLYTATFLFAMNKARYEGLPDDLRQVIDESIGLTLAAEIGLRWDEAEVKGRAAAEARGNSFHAIEGEELARWRETTAPVVTDWIAAAEKDGRDGGALVEAARAAVARFAEA